MAVIIKCKMCGGDLQITEGSTVCECEYCGTKQTVPTLDNEKKLTLFSRAGRLLRNCEFDKASGVFESIVAEFPEEAEAYWGLVLCKYGIEYVDDPATGKKIPTCHRSSFESVLDDVNFEQACENTDAVARRVYRDEAHQLEELRKSIIEVSGKEEPYDIFISYKETDENGSRTLDSVIAQDIYTELTEKGYRVFFSRISLEDKLGVEYEPYIFAALNSAKVMLVVGTDYEYFDAVWVKNEWSRFLKLIASGQKKVLIPVFKNMDPYDMPREFSKLAAQDMGKVGAMQDLLRGVEKVFGNKNNVLASNNQSEETIKASQYPTVASLLDRAFIFLKDGKFDKADEYAEKVLDIDARNAQAYLCKLMCSLQTRVEANLVQESIPFENNPFYIKILEFGDEAFVRVVTGYNKEIKERIRKSEEKQQKEREINLKKLSQDRDRLDKLKKELVFLHEQKTHPELLLSDKEKEEYAELVDLNEKAVVLAREKEIAAKAIESSLSEIESQISFKQKYLTSLGIFKGNEKKSVQIEIDKLISRRTAKYTEWVSAKSEASDAEDKVKKANADVLSFRIHASADAVNTASEQIRKVQKELIDLERTVQKRTMLIEGHGTFGRFYGDKIEWLVLTWENNKALLISKYALDCQQYHSSYTNITWEKCTLRSWLNSTFLNAAFSADEQKQIVTSTVKADKNPNYNTSPGNDTKDKVFLLSITEVSKYFSSDSARQCKPTPFAVSKNCYVDKVNGNCWWWLRSPGYDQGGAAYVYTDGSVNSNGYGVGLGNYAIRPALWINLDS